jgi:hypothetical protein
MPEGQYFTRVEEFTHRQLFESSNDRRLDDVTAKRIRSFRKLCPGWNYGEGVSIPPSHIKTALELNEKALQYGFLQRDAFPGIDGEVMVTIYEGESYLEFTIEAPDQIAFVREDGGVETDEGDAISDVEVEDLFRQLRKDICASYDSSMDYITTISDYVDSRALHLSHPARMEGFRLSVVSA